MGDRVETYPPGSYQLPLWVVRNGRMEYLGIHMRRYLVTDEDHDPGDEDRSE